MKRIPFYIVALFALFVAFSLLGDGARAQDGIAGAGNKAILDLPGCTDHNLGGIDDSPSASATLPSTLNFFGSNYSSVWVNNNGNVTFGSALSTYTPFDLTSTAQKIIAPYFADVDTRGAGSGLATYGSTTYSARPAFCVDWVNVGYFSSHTDKLNSFQLLLVDRADTGAGNFDIIFNYNKVQWETGDATSSGGSGGLGGHSARAGYSNGSTDSLELPGSAVNSGFLDSTPSGLIHGSRGTTQHGRYIFPVRSGAAPTGGFVSGRVLGDRGDGLNEPLAGASVQICRQDVVPAVCSPTTTDASGSYNVAGLPAGTYNGVAGPPADRPDLFPDVNALFPLGNNQGHIDYDFKLLLPRPLPPGVTIQGIGATSGGAPVINWAGPVQVTKMNANCQGGAGTFELIKDGEVIASGPMSETATPGLFKGIIPPLRPQHGPAVLHIEVSCPGVGEDKDIEADVYIDPSGTVKTPGGTPIQGATVTLYHSDSAAGPFEVVPDGSAIMSPSNRTNPDLTDADGFFHWDVIVGFYKVRAEKSGCHNPNNAAQTFVETIVLEIPPPALDLDLRLECGGGPAPTPTPAIQYGNVNCVGGVNSIDAALVLQYGASLITSLACQAVADVNQNGSVNSIDAALILQFVSGLLDHLPV